MNPITRAWHDEIVNQKQTGAARSTKCVADKVMGARCIPWDRVSSHFILYAGTFLRRRFTSNETQVDFVKSIIELRLPPALINYK